MRSLSLIIFFTTLLTSCNEGSVKKKELVGKWSLYKAERNGRETKTMDSSYFVFTDDNYVTSNILQSGIKTKFDLKNNALTINDVIPIELKITEFSKDSMVLEGMMNNFVMTLSMTKE